MKLDFNKPFKNIDGKTVKVATGNGTSTKDRIIGQLLAELINGPVIEISALKALDWGTKLYNGEPIEIDRSDFELLKKVVEDSGATNLIKGRILEVFIQQGGEENGT